MNLDDFVAVSGKGGIFKLVANRSNGLIIEDIDSGKKKFASGRLHQFTPLSSIGIYTDTDTAELKEVFAAMLQHFDKTPPVKPTASNPELHEYFAIILPEYDRDRVHIKDIKKVIKWFTFLKERDLLSIEEAEKKEDSKSDKSEEE